MLHYKRQAFFTFYLHQAFKYSRSANVYWTNCPVADACPCHLGNLCYKERKRRYSQAFSPLQPDGLDYLAHSLFRRDVAGDGEVNFLSSNEFLIPTFAKNILLKKYFYIYGLMPALALVLMSWGYTGHEKISHEAHLSYSQEMSQFDAWTDFLASHASDADERKAWDPDEGIKHYIDIDNYQQFINYGTIPQTLDSVIDIYGYNFVYDQGILPWATLTTFDSLVACMARHDWNQAKYFAADLGHYVGDGHMPLHITRNYNGQYSGNNGIHSRYESTMINNYIDEISYVGYNVDIIDDISQYVFSYLYTNYTYVDSVLIADDYAQNISGNTNSIGLQTGFMGKIKKFYCSAFCKCLSRSCRNDLQCLGTGRKSVDDCSR